MPPPAGRRGRRRAPRSPARRARRPGRSMPRPSAAPSAAGRRRASCRCHRREHLVAAERQRVDPQRQPVQQRLDRGPPVPPASRPARRRSGTPPEARTRPPRRGGGSRSRPPPRAPWPIVCPRFSAIRPPASPPVSRSSARTVSTLAQALRSTTSAAAPLAHADASPAASARPSASSVANSRSSPRAAIFAHSPSAARSWRGGSDRSVATSITTVAGWWKAPTRFLPSGRSTAVLPPIDESTCATSVVGTPIQGTPRR